MKLNIYVQKISTAILFFQKNKSCATTQYNFRFFKIRIFENYMFKQISKSTKMYLFLKGCVWEKIAMEEIYCACLAQLSTSFIFLKFVFLNILC